MLKFNSYTVRQTGADQNILISISNNTDLGGLSDGLNSFIEKETGLSINPVDDGDIIVYVPTVDITYEFEFYNSGTTSYGVTLENAGFISDDLNTDFLYKSYYIFQVYDSIKSESQKLLHTGFFCGYLFPTGFTSSYLFTPSREISNFYLKNIDLSNYTGNSVYLKVSFFNAKKGKQQLFYNSSKSGDLTENIFYFDIILDKNNNSYNMSSFVTAKEFINFTYVNKINENTNVTPQEKPVYPTGNTLILNQYFNLE